MTDELLTINEWLDAIGCDRAYRKDMKETYKKAIPELKAQLAKVKQHIEEAKKQGFDEGVRKTTDAMDSTFSAQLKEAKKQERESIINQLQELIELSEKNKEPSIKVKMLDILQSLKDNE